MMQRRTLLRIAALSAGAASSPGRLLSAVVTPPPGAAVRTVLLITKCHLDVGFTMTQARVMKQYFEVYFPSAMRTAADLRLAGGDRYRWTTGSWLLYEYLEQASTAQRNEVDRAVAAGDLAWHALPFSWQTEMIDRSMIEGALSLSSTLDARFGVHTIAAKMTDVPGHTRGIIAPLAAAGVRLLDIGVNAASTPPEVPDVFLWRDAAGHELALLYHRHDYGSVIAVPGTEVAIAVFVRGDNSGPHTSEEIATMYSTLRSQFPGATVRASDLNEAAAVVDRVRTTLPVVTAEIGDTWIYGVASDPVKVARYREMARLRRSWIAGRLFATGDATDRLLLRRLCLAPEHTWGTDTKSYLDNDHYRAKDLAQVFDQPGYQTMLQSWQEKRDDIDAGIHLLPPALQTEAQAHLRTLETVAPNTGGMTPHTPQNSQTSLTSFTTRHLLLDIDRDTGAIVRLQVRGTAIEWASAAHPIGLLTYQTLSSEQYAGFLDRYVKSKADWAPRDFGKPGLERFSPSARDWHPRLAGSWSSRGAEEDRLLLALEIDDPASLASGNVAWPRRIFIDLRMPHLAPRLDLRVITLDKQPTRMPEAMWLTFAPPSSPRATWHLEKSGEPVSAEDVVRGGGRAMHAIGETLEFRDQGRVLRISSADTPLVALGDRSPLNFSLDLPGRGSAAHFCLFNNAWGTNYPQWSGGNWTYRFNLTPGTRDLEDHPAT